MGNNKGVNTALFNHKSTWDTTKTSVGSSNSDQIKLPLEASGTYNFIIYWGDDSSDTITAWDQAEVTHTYASSGIYNIEIVGQLEGFRFNDTGDRLKLSSIENGGNEFKLGNNNGYFRGCGNLTSVVNLDTSEVTDMSYMFFYCSKFNQSLPSFDTSKVTTMRSMFSGCSTFNQPLANFDTPKLESTRYMFYSCSNFNQDISNFDTSNVITMEGMFYECSAFNQPLNFDTSEVTNMSYMFYDCSTFNQSLSSFNTSKVTMMYAMLYSCSVFNQDISNFDVEGVTNLQNMLAGATSWSQANYDLFLISVAGQTVISGLTFNCSSNYTLGGAAEAARTSLVNDDSWTISDLGGV